MDLRSQLRNITHSASLRRLARTQPIPATRAGDGTINVGGNILRARPVTNEAIGVGEAVFVNTGGAIEQERRTVRREESVGHGSVNTGRVKVLVLVEKGAVTELWVGGHVVRPFKAKELNSNLNIETYLENIGRGINDFIVAYKGTQQAIGGRVDGATIGVIYGAEPNKNWEISNQNAQYLQYWGNGFWASGAQNLVLPTQSPYKNTKTTTTPEVPLGNWVNVGTSDTDAYELQDGPASTTYGSEVTESGLPDSVDQMFAGASNNSFAKTVKTKYWDGVYAGGARLPFPSNPPTGPNQVANEYRDYQDAQKVLRTSFVYTRDLSATSYSFSAFEGSFSASSGSFQIKARRESVSQAASRKFQYFGCQYASVSLNNGSVFGGPPEYVWQRFCGLGGERIIPAINTSDDGPFVFSQGVSVAIAPNETKNYEFRTTNSTGTAYTRKSPTPSQVFDGGFLWNKFEDSGACGFSETQAPTTSANQTVRQKILNYQGEEFIFSSSAPVGKIHVLLGETYPAFVDVPTPDVSVDSSIAIKISRKVGGAYQSKAQSESRNEKVYKIAISENQSVEAVDFY